MKPAEILSTHRAHFDDEGLSRAQEYNWRKLFKKARQRLKTCHTKDG
jgi:hypothetical protein